MNKAKRFWKEVRVADGLTIALDARLVKTPAKSALVLPSQALAEAVAEEWRALPLESEINPDAMPLTKMANSAIDRVGKDRAAIEEILTEYIGTDLICYRADAPEALVERQGVWDDWIIWAQKRGFDLKITQGIMPIEQPAVNFKMAREWLSKASDFELVAIHDMISLTGSFILGMALFEKALDAQAAFDLAHIDEIYQAEEWGEDEDAAEARAQKGEALIFAARFLELL